MTRNFMLTVRRDAQALLRVLAPFAVRGLAPRSMSVDQGPDAMTVRLEFDDLACDDADWLCARLSNLPTVSFVTHRPATEAVG